MEKVTDKLYNWASDIEPDTIQQALRTSRLPFVDGHVSLMPDAHLGMGATVGSVIPTDGAIIPAAIGVDIGCGMIANRLNLTSNELPDDLDGFMRHVEESIPAGVGQGHKSISIKSQRFLLDNPEHSDLDAKLTKTVLEQFGTLGSGNHFFEICLDESDNVWFVLHSGSRGIGNKLAQGHIKKAKQMMKDLHIGLEDPDLAYFTQQQPEFFEYIIDMTFAQEYAMANRQAMMDNVLKAFIQYHKTFTIDESINCHHNFTQREVFNGKSVWITRKGAIKAASGDKGIIPGSMGTKTYIVEGKGSLDSYNSCSHGAGRRMSRSRAKKEFTEDDLRETMKGKVWNADRAKHLVDEIAGSYKDIDQVMDDQKDLVTVEHTLSQIFNYKG